MAALSVRDLDDSVREGLRVCAAQRGQAGYPIWGFNAQIAAVCRLHTASLATRNTDDFLRLHLHLVDPWLASG